ncbi:MAG: HIRAN domain-containing protein [Burkholderiales bacterium]
MLHERLHSYWAFTHVRPEIVATPSRTRRQLLLQSSPVAGFQYHFGQELWKYLRAGLEVELVREPDNAHDGHAVRVERLRYKLGYVPRSQNHAVAQLLDRGEKLSARIASAQQSENPWQRLSVNIYLEV